MNAATTLRTTFGDGIATLTTFFASDRVVAARHVIGEVWWRLLPAVSFAVRVALLTLLLGFSRWADLDTFRTDIADADTSRPTLLAVVDAFDSVSSAAEAVGSSIPAANVALWLGGGAAVLAVALSAVSIMVSPAWAAAPPLPRSMAWFPRRLVREIFVVLIACAILARVAGEPSYLFSPVIWTSAALFAAVMGLTILAEQRWMGTSTAFITNANLPIGAATAGTAGGAVVFTNDFRGTAAAVGGRINSLGHGDGRTLDPLAGTPTPAADAPAIDTDTSTDTEENR